VSAAPVDGGGLTVTVRLAPADPERDEFTRDGS
jgi:hypothetical protein